MVKNFYTLALYLALILLPTLVLGQGISSGGVLEMSLSPQNPEPFQEVKITINSYREDLSRARVTWFVDAVEKNTGLGLDEFSVPAGKNGTRTTVKAVVTPFGGEPIEISKSFTPSIVDLIYEARSYVPPFYKGRALNPSQGLVVVTAIPELIKTTGEKIDSRNIVYSWKKDGTPQPKSSGLSKNTLTFTGEIPVRDALIEVFVSSLDSTLSASKIIKITNEDPKIVFYENSPVYGLMTNRAIRSTVNMLVDEFNTVAVPYFFSIGNIGSLDLEYIWKLDGQKVENQEQKNSLVFRQERSGSGSAAISLDINNKIRLFQSQSSGFTISFKKDQ